ncbi:MAG: HAD-IA family hydrolase [Thermoleophilia bacterium]
MHHNAVARTHRAFRLRAVLFDFDGTLTRPGALDFAAVKREVGCPPDRYVLEWVQALPLGARRTAALAALERFELAGAAASEPNQGAEDVVRRLRALGLRVGVLTRNGLPAVECALEHFVHLGLADFDVIVTRGDEVRPKPAADGVLHAAQAMGATAAETLMVGDYLLDMEAGHAAGAVTAYLTNGRAGPREGGVTRAPKAGGDVDDRGCPGGAACDFVVHTLAELDAVVRLGLPLLPGKLPNDLLARHLEAVAPGDPAVLVSAGVGEDVAALDLSGLEVLVAHGDPITLASAQLARFAVLVNANDIATSGGEPRWLLSTVLLPEGTTPSEALALLAGIADEAAEQGIAVVGGHTEVSDAVTRPVVSATLLGTVGRAGLRDKRAVLPGDVVILTKGLAVEGTALLAQELGERLRALGMSVAELEACARLLDRVSVVPEARIARGYAGVRALHDVTEGGLATALRELAAAGGHAITVHRERIPVLPETARVCALLQAEPLGLIGSGSLLVCCRPDEAGPLLNALRIAGIDAAAIAEVGAGDADGGTEVIALDRGRPAAWPEFTVDEAARLLAAQAR